MSTIVGLGTALSNSAINIIRMSGKESLNIINKIFHTNHTLNPNEIKYGLIKYNDELYDEVLVSFMKGPKSFTGEDIIEINCHGGTLITNKILNLLIDLGAKLAEPGEFTKRAFLNGKMDLTKAEAIFDIINAKSDYELKCALDQKSGKLYSKMQYLKEQVIFTITNIEAIVEFEDELDENHIFNVENSIQNIINNVNEILKYKDQGRIIKQGIDTCIVGKPNVGKSSLLNYLCDYNKAIVTDIPGTTRDIVEEIVNIDGIILNLFDTAGIRKTEDVVESIGINKAKEKVNESSLIFFILDSTRLLNNEDMEIYDLVKDKNLIILLNKSDENPIININTVKEKFNIKDDKYIINISVKEKIGFDKLTQLIKQKFLLEELSLKNDSIIITNMRHIEALTNCIKYLNKALDSLKNSIPLDIISIDLRKSLNYIMNITGEDITELIVDNIFSKFCIGK